MIDPATMLQEFATAGFAEIALPLGQYEGMLKLAQSFYKLPLEARFAAAAFRTSGVLGYYPSESEAVEIGRRYGDVPLFEGKRARGYCSFDFIANERARAQSALFDSEPWPADAAFLPRAQELYREISSFMADVSRKLLLHLLDVGRAPWLPPSVIDDNCCSIMRLLKYSKGAHQRESKPHTDYELLSLIVATGLGLEVRSPSGQWSFAPCSTGHAILLPGDILEAATSGAIPSSLHRVSYGADDRLAVIFFQGIGLDRELSYVVEGERHSLTFGQHLCGMLIRGAPHLQSKIAEWEHVLGRSIPERNPFKNRKEESRDR